MRYGEVLAGALALLIPFAAWAGPAEFASAQSARDHLRPLAALLGTPEHEIDFGKAKIVIDQFIDPAVDPVEVEGKLAELVASVKERIPEGASTRAKIELLLSTLYESGQWNGKRPFVYDLDDPFGRSVRNKLLSTYLVTRRGNCVSMPILVLILGQKIGLTATLAIAPEHMLVKFLDSNGQWLNVEATSGGFKFDSSYERELNISAKATANRVYLRPLSPLEAIGAMLSTAMEEVGGKDQQEQRIAIADLALSVNPYDVVAMTHKGAAYYMLLQQRYVRVYSRPDDIPAKLLKDFENLSQQNLAWYGRAEELGWVPSTLARDEVYLRNIQLEESRRKEK